MTMIKLTLYGRAGCHLCEELHGTLGYVDDRYWLTLSGSSG